MDALSDVYRQLSELAAENKLEGFGLFGVIKETGVVSLKNGKSFVFCILFARVCGNSIEY